MGMIASTYVVFLRFANVLYKYLIEVECYNYPHLITRENRQMVSEAGIKFKYS